MASETRTNISTTLLSGLFRRVCEHMGIAFSKNYVFPGLADVEESDDPFLPVDHLNAIGRNFGIRFREMHGSLRDLVNTVSDSGPVLIKLGKSRSINDEPALILEMLGRGKVQVHQAGEDQQIPIRSLGRLMSTDEEGQYIWLLIQPVLAAENASRYQYQSGTHENPMKPLSRLFALLKPEARDLRTILIFSIVIGLLSLTTPLAVEAVVNTIAFGRYLQPLIVLSLIVLTFLGFRAGLNVMMTMVTETIQRKLFVRTVEDLSYRLTRVPLSTWKKYHGPELVNRFFDIVGVQKITSKLLLETLMLLLQTAIGLTVLAFYHPFLLGYDIGLVAMMTVVLWFIGRGAVRTAQEESQFKYETAGWLQEIARHPGTFKFNGGLGFAINRADELAAQYVNHRQSHFRILIRQISFSMAMQVIAATTLLALGGYLVIEGQMTLGQLVAAELIVTVILGSFAKLGKDLESFYDLMASVDKLGKLFDLPIESVKKLRLPRRPGAYSSSLVDLAEGTSDVTINFEAGSAYAIRGATELPRTRLMELMTGQINPEQGYVLLDDFRVDALSAESLQEKISLISEVELFEGSVDENIRLARENVGSQQANEIVDQLGLRKVIAGLSDGFSTKLSVCGYPLCQGDAIRLILARALISKPGILFIDGLLDRLSDDDTLDVLARLERFKSETTMVISTGRRAIADWADKSLDIGLSNWVLRSHSG